MSLVPYNGSRSSRFLGPRFCHPSFNFQDGWKNWSGESVSRRSLFTLSPPHLTGHWPLCSTQHLTFHGRSGYYFSLLQSPQSFCKQEIQNNVAWGKSRQEMRLFGGTELVLQLTLESAPASGTVLLPVLVVLLLLVVLVVLVKVLGACVQNERLRHARGSRGAQSATIF